MTASMEPLLLKAILERLILFFVPIALGYLWRLASERRAEAQPRPLPAPTHGPGARAVWLWLVAVGAALVAGSLIVGPLSPHAPDRSVYVPGEVAADGRVTPGHFAPAPSR